LGRKQTNAAGGLTALFIFCVASLVLFTIYVKEGDCTEPSNCGPLHTVQLGAAEVLRPVRGLFAAMASPIDATKEGVGGAFDGTSAAEEEKLREEAARNEERAAQASRLAVENERLRELLKGEREFYEYGPLAKVVAPVGGQLTQRIIIDVGTEDGVKPEMPVVVGNNTLIGRTTSQVTDGTAEVMLVTDQNFRAGVRIIPPAEFDPSSGELSPAVTSQDVSYGEGLLQTGWEGSLGVDYVDLSARAEKGDFVVTSGRSGDRESLFPPGLFVGTVETASSQDIEQFKEIVITPAERPDDLEEVRVIVNW
jgi:rod shape-determining protein MreC